MMWVLIIVSTLLAALVLFWPFGRKKASVKNSASSELAGVPGLKEISKGWVSENGAPCLSVARFNNTDVQEFYNAYVRGRVFFMRQHKEVVAGFLKHLDKRSDSEREHILKKIYEAVNDLGNCLYVRKAILVLFSESLKGSDG